MMRRRSVLGLLGTAPLAAATGVLTTSAAAHADHPGLAARIQQIIRRAEFGNARWGMEFATLGAARPTYALIPDQPFMPASAMKVFVAGTAFSALGPEYRFRTRVYRTGPVVRGVLRGDLVLVASGDMLVCGRMRPDGTLALPEPDHSYDRFPGAVAAPGDPLQVIRGLAGQVAARGVRHIEGRVLVDAPLFREAKEDIASGGMAPITVSPMMINDNLVDVTVTPGAGAGAPGVLRISPDTSYVHIVNETRTVADTGTARPLRYEQDTLNPDGTRTVRLTGDVPLGNQHRFAAYYVPEPVRFAELAFTQALREKGVRAEAGPVAAADVGAVAAHDTVRNRLAEHVSPPVSEEVKVMLKVSSNIHTVMWPHVVGSIAGHDSEHPEAAYEELKRRVFRRAGVDPDAPGVAEGRYSADFFVRFLSYAARRPYFRKFRLALPIMGRDGSLANIQPDSPAAGHVYAKTGTGVGAFDPTRTPRVFKALAGYIHLPNGQWAAFAQFMDAEVASVAAGLELANQAAQAMGEIATAVYECS
jgi:PBP4 family serine-type D-alanyl-D-alanine carboxypeptidase